MEGTWAIDGFRADMDGGAAVDAAPSSAASCTLAAHHGIRRRAPKGRFQLQAPVRPD